MYGDGKRITGIEKETRNDENLAMQEKLISVVWKVQANNAIHQENTKSFKIFSCNEIAITLKGLLLDGFYEQRIGNSTSRLQPGSIPKKDLVYVLKMFMIIAF